MNVNFFEKLDIKFVIRIPQCTCTTLLKLTRVSGIFDFVTKFAQKTRSGRGDMMQGGLLKQRKPNERLNFSKKPVKWLVQVVLVVSWGGFRYFQLVWVVSASFWLVLDGFRSFQLLSGRSSF